MKYLDNYLNWLARQEFAPDKQLEADLIVDQLRLKHNQLQKNRENGNADMSCSIDECL